MPVTTDIATLYASSSDVANVTQGRILTAGNIPALPFLRPGNNLSDLTNIAQALINLGLTTLLVPVGARVNMSGTIVPAGYLKADGSAVSRTVYANLFDYYVTQHNFPSLACNVSVGTPAVITKTAHLFTGGERVRFSTTGNLPTGLSTAVDYYVIYLTADTFAVSTTWNGTAVASSGTQTGSHTFKQSLHGLGNGTTTFNVPDWRGTFERAWDNGRGLDTGRSLGTRQDDQNKSHSHTATSTSNSAGAHSHGGKTSSEGGHKHSFAVGDNGGSGGPHYGSGGYKGDEGSKDTSTVADHYHNISSDGAHTHTVTTTLDVNGGAESRPQNITTMACVKY